MKNDTQELLKNLGIGLTNNRGEDRTFIEVVDDIRLIFNKLSINEQEHVVSKLFHQNVKEG